MQKKTSFFQRFYVAICLVFFYLPILVTMIFSFNSSKSLTRFTDVYKRQLLTNVIICLGDAYDKEASGILRMLEVLLSDKRNASEKRMILQDDFGIQMEMDLESEVTDVGHVLDDVAQRNYEKGVCESLVSSIKTLTETMNWSVDQAMDALKISEEDKEEIRKKYNICLLYTSEFACSLSDG